VLGIEVPDIHAQRERVQAGGRAGASALEVGVVDFRKKLGKKTEKKTTDPIAIYDSLDRASDNLPLSRQDAVLSNSCPAEAPRIARLTCAKRLQSRYSLPQGSGSSSSFVGLMS